MADDPSASFIAPVEGEELFAFYQANDHPQGYRFAHLSSQFATQPLTGLTSGWLRATVVQVKEESRCEVNFHGHFCDVYSMVPQNGLKMIVPVGALLRAGSARKPLISVLCVRWWDYWAAKYWSDYKVTSDAMVRDLLDGQCSVGACLPEEHEVYTVFIRRSEDLDAISEVWASSVMLADHRAAWYLLWPSARSVFERQHAACVCEKALFSLLQRLERIGIRSCWPQPSQLYRILCGKLWVPQMCLNRDYRVPPTTRVHFQEFVACPHTAARTALEKLLSLQAALWGKQELSDLDSFRGVAKLGFSWQGKDVAPFVGCAGLELALRGLLLAEGSTQLSALVQCMVPSVACELRAVLVRDAKNCNYTWQKVYMQLYDEGQGGPFVKKKKGEVAVQGFSLTGPHSVEPDKATDEFFSGDLSVRLAVEAEADVLVQRWLDWFSTECSEPIPAARIDFLVSWQGSGHAPTLWTCEVGECGTSMCGFEVHARTAAVLNFTLATMTGDPRFPLPLPPMLRRADAY